MFHPSGYENAHPDGFGVLEVVGDGDAGQARRFVPLRRTELRGEVAGPLAALRLTQVFGYAAEQCDRVLEAAYRFPLPGDAAVTAVRVRFGDAEIRAELKERQQAEADYDRAKEQGRQAALATREAPDVFTLQVAGIRPDQEVTVETSYVQLARPEGPGWSLRIPLTTAPRYVRSDEAGARPAAGQPLGLLRDPGHRFALDLAVRGADAVESPTHPLELIREGDRRRVRLRDGEVLPDRDCVLTWRRRAGPRPPRACTSWCTTTRPPGTPTSWRWWPPRRPATRGGACPARSSCWSTTPARWRGPSGRRPTGPSSGSSPT